jgi:cysteine desulfurase/selenocysteine lyase
MRRDFPLLANSRLAYLDSAASTQKPQPVLDAMQRFYTTSYANVHRGIYPLAEQATAAYEAARQKVAKFINAQTAEVILTRGTTDSLNLLARALCANLVPGDEVVVTEMEHHSNFVPWQQLAKQKSLTLKVIAITPDDTLDMEDARTKITERTRVVAVTHVSNVLGTINPIQELARLAHARGAFLVVDGAQAVAHLKTDVKALDADFYAFSSHKMYGPDGVGVLYGRRELLEQLEPSAWGGEMVSEVKLEESTWNEVPYRFEPGTPPITQAVGLGAAIDYLQMIGMEKVMAHERDVATYALEQFNTLKGVRLLGPHDQSLRLGVFAFVVDSIHPHDVAQVLADNGVAVRAGSHCAGPLHSAKGLDATTRASIGLYTTQEDIDRLIAGLRKAQEIFR